jgi:inorganic pyrophosphatase
MSYHSIPLGKNAPARINAVIEIPKGCANKFEYDEEMDEIKLDRVLHSPMHYPLDYGFVPQTRSADGDHLDIMVVISTPLFSGCVVAVRPIGVLDMEDEAGQDWKIVGVAEKDPRMNGINSIDDLGEHFRKEAQHFFEEYKKLEGKWAKVRGWRGVTEAHQLIQEGARRFATEKH